MGASESKISLVDALRAVATREQVSELPFHDEDHPFWSTLWQDDSILMEDILEAIPSSIIREVVHGNPDAAFVIIEKLVGVIKKFISPTAKEGFPTVRHYVADAANIRRLLYACRMLCRIFPLIFESRELRRRLAAMYCPSFLSDGPDFASDKLVLPDGQAAFEDGKDSDDAQWYGLGPAVLDLLFVPGFTLPTSASEENVKVFYSIWESGIGSDRQMDSFHQIELNRMEIIRLILVLFSWRMYQEPSSRELPPFAYIISCKLKEPVVLSLLCSLLNVLLKFNPNSWSVPYSHLFFTDEHDEQLATLCVQLLNLLLDFDPQLYESTGDDIIDDTEVPPTAGTLPASSPLETKHRSIQDSPGLAPLFEHVNDTNIDKDSYKNEKNQGLVDRPDAETQETTSKEIDEKPQKPKTAISLLNVTEREEKGFVVEKASSAMLPASHRQITIYPEIMILLWRMIDLNASFFKFIVYEETILELVAALTYYASSVEMDQSADGLVHLSCFVLLQLSSERELAIRLNTPFTDHKKVADGVEFSGSHADLVILSFIRILSVAEGRLLTIGECLLTAILNIAPYIKSMSTESTHRLIGLFEQVVRRAIEESSLIYAKCAQLIIRTFVAIIQYQYDGNVDLIAALLRKRRLFEGISALTYADYMMGILPAGDQSSVAIPPETRPNTERAWTEAEFADAAHLIDCSLLVQVFHSIDPDLKQLMARKDEMLSEQDMATFLQHRTLVGLIPIAYPLQVVRFRMSPEIQSWLTSYLYGIVCLHQEQASLWNDTAIKLFVVKYEGEEDEAKNPDVLPLMP